MENLREIEKCPTCGEHLEHFNLRGEDIFGCRKCRTEVTRDEAVIIDERYCPFCKNWYNVNDGHSCWEMRSGLY